MPRHLLLRLPDDLGRLLRVGAAIRGQSQTAYILECIRAHTLGIARGPHGAPLRALLDEAASQPQG